MSRTSAVEERMNSTSWKWGERYMMIGLIMGERIGEEARG